MAKDNKPASAYAKPHTMDGNKVNSDIGYETDPNSMSANESTPGGMPARRVSVGRVLENVKSEGIVTRGNGCATKGKIARGPMA
jgi:hypothetical protein